MIPTTTEPLPSRTSPTTWPTASPSPCFYACCCSPWRRGISRHKCPYKKPTGCRRSVAFISPSIPFALWHQPPPRSRDSCKCYPTNVVLWIFIAPPIIHNKWNPLSNCKVCLQHPINSTPSFPLSSFAQPKININIPPPKGTLMPAPKETSP